MKRIPMEPRGLGHRDRAIGQIPHRDLLAVTDRQVAPRRVELEHMLNRSPRLQIQAKDLVPAASLQQPDGWGGDTIFFGYSFRGDSSVV